jgi:hypothetical protein
MSFIKRILIALRIMRPPPPPPVFIAEPLPPPLPYSGRTRCAFPDACKCREWMGNDFYFLPFNRCLEDGPRTSRHKI